MKKLKDGRFFIGLGIGLIIGVILMMSIPEKELAPREIEMRARAMGMVYEDEIKALTKSQEGEESN